jgi:acyl-CoA reductase-like NAD-dependent aldehyde dehydrogenase
VSGAPAHAKSVRIRVLMATASQPAQLAPAPAHLSSLDPSNGEVIAQFEITPAGEVAGIVERARRAQSTWARVPLAERCAKVARVREVLYARRQEIAELVTREAGKPRVESLFAEVLVALDICAFYATNAARMLRSERVPHHNLAMKSKSGRLFYEPFGVIGVISPWNYPLAVPMGTVVPALVAGNTVVLKPSELTPWCGSLVAELFQQAGFPHDLLQVIQGGGEIGAALIAARPDKVVFTGSVETGRRVAAACAEKLIPSVLELGGKDAMLVLASADQDIASSAAVWGSFTNCGQACLSVERIYVERGVADKFIQMCVEKTKRLKLGSPLDPETEVGTMIRPTQVDRVTAQLDDAVARGARILTGGRRRPDLGPAYFEPTVVTGVTPDMKLMQEETFGPVLAVAVVDSAAEAVRLANDSEFGLSASVWTGDARQGREIAAQLRAGSVMVNDVASYFGICEAPHGGRGASGWGRTHSRAGLLELVQAKYVDVDLLPRWSKAWWYGYNQSLAVAADHFLQFLFAQGIVERLKGAPGAMRSLFRDSKI